MSSPSDQVQKTPLHECPYIAANISKLDQEIKEMTDQVVSTKQFVQSVLGQNLSTERCQGVLDTVVQLDISVTPTVEHFERQAIRIEVFLRNTGLPANNTRAALVREQVGIAQSLTCDLRYYRDLLKQIIAPPEGMDSFFFRSFSQTTLDSKILSTYGEQVRADDLEIFETVPPDRYRSFANENNI
jgi:glycerol-3-phosphate O-acyltransferase